MFCTKCGKELKEGMKFCASCGTPVKIKNKAESERATSENLHVNAVETQYSNPSVDTAETYYSNPSAEASGKADEIDGRFLLNDRRFEKEDFRTGAREVIEGVRSRPKTGLIVTAVIVLVILIILSAGAAFRFSGGQEHALDMTDVSESVTESETDNTPASAEEQQESYEEQIVVPAASEEKKDYILEHSSDTYLTRQDLIGLDEYECKIARNEIYARHGRRFQDEELQAYFDSCSWYNGTIDPSDFKESELSDIEVANRQVIVAYEQEMGYETTSFSSVDLEVQQIKDWYYNPDSLVSKKEIRNNDKGLNGILYYHDGKLFFAFYFKDKDEYRMYFVGDRMIRFIGPDGQVVDTNLNRYSEWEHMALEEAYQ